MSEKTATTPQDLIDKALDIVMLAERERVLALVSDLVRDCPLEPNARASAFQTLLQDIRNGEVAR